MECFACLESKMNAPKLRAPASFAKQNCPRQNIKPARRRPAKWRAFFLHKMYKEILAREAENNRLNEGRFGVFFTLAKVK